MAASEATSKVPVTILTGFLGSGKTTLLNHILTAQHGKKIAIIENEFGEVGIDDALLEKNVKTQSTDEVIEMLNGCLVDAQWILGGHSVDALWMLCGTPPNLLSRSAWLCG